MIVTINTDASFSNKHKLGAYAFWIVSNQGKIAKSGILRKHCSRPEQAEFQCIINAFHCVSLSGWSGITKIIVNTDCLNVIHLIENNSEAIRKYRLGSWGRFLKHTYECLVRKSKMNKIPIEWRHVKAHESTSTSKQWVNDWCDREAKLQLYKATDLINK